jgi:hypothetical protein
LPVGLLPREEHQGRQEEEQRQQVPGSVCHERPRFEAAMTPAKRGVEDPVTLRRGVVQKWQTAARSANGAQARDSRRAAGDI